MTLQSVHEVLSEPIQKLGNLRYLRAIKMGFVMVSPFLIASGVGLAISLILARYSIVLPFSMDFVYQLICMSTFLWVAYGIGSSMANDYGSNANMGGMYSLLGCLLVLFPWVMNMDTFQIQEEYMLWAFFPSIILALAFGEVKQLLSKLQFKLDPAKGYPEAVTASFNELIPLLGLCIVTVVLTSISPQWIFFIHTIGEIVTSFLSSLPGMLILVCGTCFFWMFGVHGANLIGLMARPFWLYMILADAYAVLHQQAIPYLAPESFFQWFVWIGGSGCTIGLVICMRYLARSAHLKSLGKSCVISTWFNINEPVIFGTPIALNPVLMIPFLLAPLGCCIVAYMAIETGFMNAPIFIAPWVLPAPLGALWASGDLNALLISFALIVLSTLVYVPFFLYHDHNVKKVEDSGSDPSLHSNS